MRADVVGLVDNAEDSLWGISGGPHEIDELKVESVTFRPLQSGLYYVANQWTVDGVDYVDTRVIEVLDVAPQLAIGDDLTVSEGRLRLTRPMIVDPGEDQWQITIDYGDGSEPQVSTTTNRNVTLDHVYADPAPAEAGSSDQWGSYTITVTVENSEGTFTDTLDVEVTPANVYDMVISQLETAVEGQPTNFEFHIEDDTFQQSISAWSYTVDWGDGTPIEFIATALQFSGNSISREAIGNVAHQYATEGSYVITLTVVDDDSEQTTTSLSVSVGNDTPEGSLVAPLTTAVEDVSTTWTVAATDTDDLTYEWDFGIGTTPKFGATVDHTFTEPGSQTVSVTVSDGVTSIDLQHTIDITNTPDAPTMTQVGTLTFNELAESTFTIEANDTDHAEVLTFSLEAAPDGLAIDPLTGQLSWTPSADAGGRTHQPTVVVTDSTGREASQTLTLRVNDSGEVRGVLFFDDNGDGSMGVAESPLTEQSVMLDIGGDGTIDMTVATDADGAYKFIGLPVGYYVVSVDFPTEWTATTPTEIRINMDVTSTVTLDDLGAGIVTDEPELDFGDAPDSYNTLAANNGASHVIGDTVLRMGARVTGEADGIPNTNADGDDLMGFDDEDGLVDPSTLLTLIPGQSPLIDVTVTNDTDGPTTLYGWIDYNQNGAFDSTEQASVTVPAAASDQIVTLRFPVVPVTIESGPTYARFRFSTDPVAQSPVGPATDGEVEDYAAFLRTGAYIVTDPLTETVFVVGDDADDFIIVDADEKSVTLNGQVHRFNQFADPKFEIDAAGGLDRLYVHLTSGDEMVVSGPDRATNLSVSGATQLIGNAEIIKVYSNGGADTARLFDQAATDDAFIVKPMLSYMMHDGTDGPLFHTYVFDFPTVIGHATGSAEGFAGGSGDIAQLYDSAGNDTATAWPSAARLTDDVTQANSTYFSYAAGFDYVNFWATAGGVDEAQFYDGPSDDLFVSRVTEGNHAQTYLRDQDFGYFNVANRFERTTAYGAQAGTDSAQFYDTFGDDLFVASGHNDAYMLTNSQITSYAKFFDQTVAFSVRGGNDSAQFYDSKGDDTFTAAAGHSILESSSTNPAQYRHTQIGFPTVLAVSRDNYTSGYDVLNVAATTNYTLTQLGTWEEINDGTSGGPIPRFTSPASLAAPNTTNGFMLDTDGDGETNPLTDGIAFMKQMAGFGDVQAPGISDQDILLDVDGDGRILPLTDGMLIVRYLAGFRGETLIAGAINAKGSRTTANKVEAWISQLAIAPSKAESNPAIAADLTNGLTDGHPAIPTFPGNAHGPVAPAIKSTDLAFHTNAVVTQLPKLDELDEDDAFAFSRLATRDRRMAASRAQHIAPSPNTTDETQDIDSVFTDIWKTGI
ncbi:PKD domain-containing protein [bacterium]|nr:PKD domain-containing protein [bacterium]